MWGHKATHEVFEGPVEITSLEHDNRGVVVGASLVHTRPPLFVARFDINDPVLRALVEQAYDLPSFLRAYVVDWDRIPKVSFDLNQELRVIKKPSSRLSFLSWVGYTDR